VVDAETCLGPWGSWGSRGVFGGRDGARSNEAMKQTGLDPLDQLTDRSKTDGGTSTDPHQAPHTPDSNETPQHPPLARFSMPASMPVPGLSPHHRHKSSPPGAAPTTPLACIFPPNNVPDASPLSLPRQLPPPEGTRTSFKFKSSFNSDLVLHNANVWGDVPGGWGYMPALYLAYGALYLPLYGETPVKLIGHLQCVRSLRWARKTGTYRSYLS
jgi:hypothetical protein